MDWAVRFGQELFRASTEDKWRVYSKWVSDVAQRIKRGEVPQDKQPEVIDEFTDKADRYFETAEGQLGSTAPHVVAMLSIITKSFEKHELNGHIHPITHNGHVLQFDRAENLQYEHIDWVWKGHLALGMMEIISGVPEMGKSQVQCDYAARVTNGWDWPDGTKGCKPSNVIMLAAEDSWPHVVVPRLIAAGADMKKIIYLKDIKFEKTGKGEIFLLQPHIDALEIAVRENNVLLVTIDPITAYMGGKIDAHKATEVRTHLNPLKALAERCHCAISILTHPAKNASNKARDQFIGSQAFIALARIGHLVVEEPETNRRLYTNAKNNIHCRMPTLAYRFEQLTIGEHEGQPVVASHVCWDSAPVIITADQAVAAANDDGHGRKKTVDTSEAVDFLKEMLADGSVKLDEIRSAARAKSLEWKAVQAAQKQLKVKATKTGVGKDAFWSWTLPSADVIPIRKVWDKDDDADEDRPS